MFMSGLHGFCLAAHLMVKDPDTNKPVWICVGKSTMKYFNTHLHEVQADLYSKLFSFFTVTDPII